MGKNKLLFIHKLMASGSAENVSCVLMDHHLFWIAIHQKQKTAFSTEQMKIWASFIAFELKVNG